MDKRRKSRDEIMLLKMLETRKEIVDTLKEFKITSVSDFSEALPVIKRGLIHAAGDMFELTKKLSDKIQDRVEANNALIKSFRNKVAHSYGTITPIEAYSWVTYCTTAELKKDLQALIDELAKEQQSSLRDTLAANQTKATEQNAELPTPPATDKPKTIDE
jgi:uncharacterized protein with HEPN domain